MVRIKPGSKVPGLERLQPAAPVETRAPPPKAASSAKKAAGEPVRRKTELTPATLLLPLPIRLSEKQEKELKFQFVKSEGDQHYYQHYGPPVDPVFAACVKKHLDKSAARTVPAARIQVFQGLGIGKQPDLGSTQNDDDLEYLAHPLDGDAAPAAPPVAASAASAVSPAPASDADADGCTTKGLSGKKRKPKSGVQKRDAKAAKTAEAGYTDKGRMAFRDEGGVLVTGDARTCMPDALCQLLPAFGVEVSKEEVRSIMPIDKNKDTRFIAADAFVRKHGLELARVTSRFAQVKGGPELALLNTVGHSFVVQLSIKYDKNDKKPDLHCVAYDGETLCDNYKYSKVKVIDASDRASKENARKPFQSLREGLQVRIQNVYELRRLA